MAPTEILAEQHFRKLAPPLVRARRTLRLGIGQPAQGRARRRLAGDCCGEADLAFGTHALFQEAGSFQRLGLAVVDEQHRFGVGQRLALMQKGMEPHQLMMSATPIPRTLAMSFFARPRRFRPSMNCRRDAPRSSPSWSAPRAATTCWHG